MRWFLLLALLAGCGFKPRGSVEFTESIALHSHLPEHHPFMRLLKQILAQNGVEIKDSAEAVLTLHSLKKKVKLFSVNSDNRALEYKVIQTLNFSFQYQERILIRKAQIEQKSLTYLPGGELLGRVREAEIQEKDAYRDLIQQLLYRIENSLKNF